MRWFGHVRRRNAGYFGTRMLKMDLPDRDKRGKPKRFMDMLKEDMQVIGMREEDAGDRKRWKRMIRYGNR